MVKSCAAYGCSNRFEKDSDLSFHSFPLKNPNLLKEWLVVLKREKFVPSKYSFLCSEHFLAEDYNNNNKKLHLKPDVVPSIFNFPDKFIDTQTPRKRPKKRNSDQIANPSTLEVSPKKVKLRRQVKTLKQKLRRKEQKIETLENLVNSLKEENMISNDVGKIIEQNFSGITKELFLSQYKNEKAKSPQGRRYSDEIKKLALTLNFYSPRAYKFLQSFLCLPAHSSIANWTSSVDCEPGFFIDVFKELQRKSRENEQFRECALMFDGVYIKSGLVYNHSKGVYEGFETFGDNIIASEEEKIATEALVIMLVGLKGHWKYPIGYVLCNGINSVNLHALVRNSLYLAATHELNIRSVTCDGTNANLECMRMFGCKLGGSLEEIDGVFKYEEYGHDIIFVPDVCHMLKLARNSLADLKELEDGNGKIIKWHHIVLLHKIQEDEGLKFANKLSKGHVQFNRHKMNVKIAAQTLSSSVADAIQYLKDAHHPSCADAEGTINFIRVVDRLFDVLNSRSPYAKGYKKPLYHNDVPRWKSILEDSIQYLSQLKVKSSGVSILKHRRKTFALGLITAAQSVLHLAQQLLSANSFPYLLTYKMSQDHLELLFACIRGKNGFNNNPDIRQFKSSMKKILLRNSIIASNRANCLMFEDHSNGSVFSLKWNKRNAPLFNQEEDVEVDAAEIPITRERLNSINVSMYQEAILGYISGFIVRKIRPQISCTQCSEALTNQHTEYGHNDHCYTRWMSPSLSLISSKNRGGLVVPSKSVLKIVDKSNKLFQLSIKLKSKINKNTMLHQIYSCMIFENLFPELEEHNKENEPVNEDMHSSQLVKKIIKKFLKIRLFAYTKQYNKDILHKDNIGKRQQSTKLILFSGI